MHRRLPHWRKTGTYFVTWRLCGSLPAVVAADVLMRDGAKFVAADRLLDAAATGPGWLAEPRIAEAMIEVLQTGHKSEEYELNAWVVMSNHVHLLLRPEGDLRTTINVVKGRTARAANRLLNRTGNPFWAKDYYDRWVRDRHEEFRIRRYIEWNPVKAGLCSVPEEYLWSSARRA